MVVVIAFPVLDVRGARYIYIFAYPPVNSTAQKKTGGGSMILIPIELYWNDQYESGCNTIATPWEKLSQ